MPEKAKEKDLLTEVQLLEEEKMRLPLEVKEELMMTEESLGEGRGRTRNVQDVDRRFYPQSRCPAAKEGQGTKREEHTRKP